jgi:hypothetical protein
MSLTPITDNNAREGADVQRLGNGPSDANVPVADGSGMDPTAPSDPDTLLDALAGEYVVRH